MESNGLQWMECSKEPLLSKAQRGVLEREQKQLKKNWRKTKFDLTMWVLFSIFQNVITFGRLKGLKAAIEFSKINLKEIQTFNKQGKSSFSFHLNQSTKKIQSFRKGLWKEENIKPFMDYL